MAVTTAIGSRVRMTQTTSYNRIMKAIEASTKRGLRACLLWPAACLDFLLLGQRPTKCSLSAPGEFSARQGSQSSHTAPQTRPPRLDSQYKNSLSFASWTTHPNPSCRCSPVTALHRRMVHLCVLMASSCSPWRCRSSTSSQRE